MVESDQAAVADTSTIISFRQIVRVLRQVGLEQKSRRVLVHASLSAIGQVRGGAETVVAALTAACHTVVMPSFTYQTLVVPETGPPDNGIDYGSATDGNAEAEFWHEDLPVHPEIGAIAERLRRMPETLRSDHPVLSFIAHGGEAQEILGTQSVDDPFGPIAWLEENDGDVLMIGVSHRVNTSIHLAERRTGRKTFVRWALSKAGIVEVPHWPGNSAGFDALAPCVASITKRGQIGTANVQRIRIVDLLDTVQELLRDEPEALLTDDPSDERSSAIRRALGSTT